MEIDQLRGAGGDISLYRAIYERLDYQDPSKDGFEDFLLDLATGGKDVNTLDPKKSSKPLRNTNCLLVNSRKLMNLLQLGLNQDVLNQRP